MMSHRPQNAPSNIIQREKASSAEFSQMIPAGGSRPAETASLTLVKDGETVRVIEVHCSCGETLRVACQYS